MNASAYYFHYKWTYEHKDVSDQPIAYETRSEQLDSEIANRNTTRLGNGIVEYNIKPKNDSTYYILRFAVMRGLENRQHLPWSGKRDKRAQP